MFSACNAERKGEREPSSPKLKGLPVNQAIAVVIADLESKENRDSNVIYVFGESLSLNGLISHLEKKTVVGLAYLELCRRDEERLERRSVTKTPLTETISGVVKRVGLVLAGYLPK